MESISLQQLRIVEDMLKQIRESIHNLEEWNSSFSDANELLTSPEGVKTLAADCMLIEAIAKVLSASMNARNNSCYPIDQKFLGKLLRVCEIILPMVISISIPI